MELSDSLIVMHGGKIAAYFEDTSTLTDDVMANTCSGSRPRAKRKSGGFAMTKKRQILFSVIRGLLAILIALLVATLLIFLSADGSSFSEKLRHRRRIKAAARRPAVPHGTQRHHL